MNDNISPALRGEIERSFGSVRDFERALESAAKKGAWTLFSTSEARLRLSYEGEMTHDTPLQRSDEALDYALLSERYALVLTNRPHYPHP